MVKLQEKQRVFEEAKDKCYETAEFIKVRGALSM